MKTQASLGWMGPDAEEILVTNRRGASVAVGDVLVLDNGRVDADSTSNQPGIALSGVSNIVVVTAQTQLHGVFGVVQTSAADNGTCRLRLRGFCDAVQVDATIVLSGATKSIVFPPAAAAVALRVLPADDALIGNVQTATACVPMRTHFIPLTVRTGAGVTDGWFNGIGGFSSALVVPT